MAVTKARRTDHSAYRAARAQVEAAIPPAQHAYVAAIRALQTSATSGNAYSAIASHAPAGQVVDALDWTGYSALIRSFTDHLASEIVTTARGAYESVLPVAKRETPPIPDISWTVRQHAAEMYAAAHAAERVQAITDTTRQAINDLVTQALREGWSPDRLAGTIKNTIGLHPRYAQAVVNYENNLIAQGTSDSQIRLQVAALRDRYLNLRAETIARTEIAQAQVDGRQEGWSQAVDAGVLSPDAQQEWLTGPAPCDECEGMEGDTCPVGGTFSDGSDGPPAHPSCVCSVALTDASFA